MTAKILRIAAVLSISLLFPSLLYSQLVNIERQRKQIKEGWQGSADFAFAINQNTSSIYQFSNTINTQYTKNRHLILLLNDITILRVKKDADNYDLINKNFQHLRYNYLIGDTSVVFEAFTQRQQNKIRYIKERFLVGGGFRFRLVNSKSLVFYVAPLAMYEYELLDDSVNSFSRMLKGDLYFSGTLKLDDVLTVSHVTYYQPALFDLGSNIVFEPVKDFRLSSETSFSFTVIDDFMEFSVNVKISYDSRPPAELRDYPLFYSVENKLTFKF